MMEELYALTAGGMMGRVLWDRHRDRVAFRYEEAWRDGNTSTSAKPLGCVNGRHLPRRIGLVSRRFMTGCYNSLPLCPTPHVKWALKSVRKASSMTLLADWLTRSRSAPFIVTHCLRRPSHREGSNRLRSPNIARRKRRCFASLCCMTVKFFIHARLYGRSPRQGGKRLHADTGAQGVTLVPRIQDGQL